jgi:hypothetical protein
MKKRELKLLARQHETALHRAGVLGESYKVEAETYKQALQEIVAKVHRGRARTIALIALGEDDREEGI